MDCILVKEKDGATVCSGFSVSVTCERTLVTETHGLQSPHPIPGHISKGMPHETAGVMGPKDSLQSGEKEILSC